MPLPAQEASIIKDGSTGPLLVKTLDTELSGTGHRHGVGNGCYDHSPPGGSLNV